MKLLLNNEVPVHQFSSFGPKGIVIGNNLYCRSLIVTPKDIYSNWAPENIDNITAADVQQIIKLEPELILIGTGHTLRFPHPSILEGATMARLAVDFMDSRAACRTYNILAAENRRVAAGIIVEHSTAYKKDSS